VDFDFSVRFGGLGVVDIGALQTAFGAGIVGVVGESDIGALQGAFGDEMAGVLGCMFSGGCRGVVGDRLVYSVVSVLHVYFLRVELDFEIVLEIVIGGVCGSTSKDDTLCPLAVGDMEMLSLTQ
jgi:hypothetical protein